MDAARIVHILLYSRRQRRLPTPFSQGYCSASRITGEKAIARFDLIVLPSGRWKKQVVTASAVRRRVPLRQLPTDGFQA